MVREIRCLSSWIEVAPALFISPTRTSNSSSLETITEKEVRNMMIDEIYKTRIFAYVLICWLVEDLMLQS
ncbi:hypothetical protein Pint_14049 [Pistacia integerrima]|uniref:Uncharacterized protein n=1 Tax=Pistacia integerrima TaxID=434235 RepID=A0ACC0YC67_9ROSI|nr:hypothetical protein Pint_14049 [Pistacia integerrima]